MSLDLRDVPLADVLRFFHTNFGLNYVLDQSVPPVRVTVALKDVPWEAALHAILEAYGLGAIVEQQGAGGAPVRVVERPR